ncbi:MAG: hypothetical protein AB1791_08370 [Chloroflexota bacterium]
MVTQKLVTGRRGKLLAFFFLAVSLALIGRVLWSNWDLLAGYRWQIRPLWFVYIVLFFTIDLLLASWAWHLLVRRLAHYDNFRHSTKICWSSNLARRMPGPVWYIAGRAVLYEQVGVSKVTTSLLSALELAFFLISGIVTTLLTSPFWALPGQWRNSGNQVALLGVGLVLTVFLVHPRILEWLWQKLGRQTPAGHLRWRDTLTWLALYVVIWVVGAWVLFSVINLFHTTPLTQVVAITGMWALAGSVSLAGALTFSGMGLREISLTLLLTQLVPAPVALVIAITVRLVWFCGELLSSLASLKL